MPTEYRTFMGPSSLPLIEDLHDRKMRLVRELRSVVDHAEKTGIWDHDDTQSSDRINQQINETTSRLHELLDLERANHDADEQRARFESIVRPDGFGSRPGELSGGIVASALRGELPRVIQTDFRSVEHTLLPDGRIEYRALSKQTNAAGAYTVPQDFMNELFRHLVENSGVRAAGARQLVTDTGQSLPVPKTLTHGGAAAVAEAATLPTSDPTFGQAVLGAYKYGQLIQVSNELATDTGVDLDSYLAEQGGANLGLASGADYVGGNGTTQPDGVAIAPAVGKTGATGQTVTVKADDLVDVFHSIVTGYRRTGTWLMRDATLASIRKIVTGISGDTTYVWQPGLVAGAPDTILGRPVITDPNMPAMAANAYSIGFGDWSRHYVIRDVVGIRFEASPDYAFANDQVTFRAVLRTDGKRVDLTAVKFYRNSAT